MRSEKRKARISPKMNFLFNFPSLLLFPVEHESVKATREMYHFLIIKRIFSSRLSASRSCEFFFFHFPGSKINRNCFSARKTQSVLPHSPMLVCYSYFRLNCSFSKTSRRKHKTKEFLPSLMWGFFSKEEEKKVFLSSTRDKIYVMCVDFVGRRQNCDFRANYDLWIWRGASAVTFDANCFLTRVFLKAFDVACFHCCKPLSSQLNPQPDCVVYETFYSIVSAEATFSSPSFFL